MEFKKKLLYRFVFFLFCFSPDPVLMFPFHCDGKGKDSCIVKGKAFSLPYMEVIRASSQQKQQNI